MTNQKLMLNATNVNVRRRVTIKRIVGIWYSKNSLRGTLGCSIILKDVRHVPNLRLNLISSMALDNQGYVDTLIEECGSLPRFVSCARGFTCGSLYKTQVRCVQMVSI